MGSTGCIISERISNQEFKFKWNFQYFQPQNCCYSKSDYSPAFCAIFSIPVQFSFRLRATKWQVDEEHKKHRFAIKIMLLKSSDVVPCHLKISYEVEIFWKNALLASEKMNCRSFGSDCFMECLSLEKDCIPTHVFSETKFKLSIALKLIFLEFSITPGVIKTSSVPSITKPYPWDLIQDLQLAYKNNTVSDITILVNGCEFKTHKFVLAARSSEFKNKIDQESKSNEIVIDDCGAYMFDKFLKYLYTNQMVDEELDIITSLYILGNKFNVKGLLIACTDKIASWFHSKSISDLAESVCNILRLAHQYSDEKLKKLATLFIVTHFSEVSPTEDWKNMIKYEPELTSEVLTQVTNRYKN